MPNEKTLANSTASRSRQGHAVNVPWVLPLGTAGSHRHTIGQEGGFRGHGERETCVSHSRPGPPAPSAGLAPRPPSLRQVITICGGYTGPCPTSRTDPWAATSNLTRDRGARGCESKATTGSCLPGFALYLQGGWRAAGHQGVDEAKSATSGTPITSCSKPVTCPSSPGVTHLGQALLSVRGTQPSPVFLVSLKSFLSKRLLYPTTHPQGRLPPYPVLIQRLRSPSEGPGDTGPGPEDLSGSI